MSGLEPWGQLCPPQWAADPTEQDQCAPNTDPMAERERAAPSLGGTAEGNIHTALLLALIVLSHCITWPHVPGHRNVFLCAAPVQFLLLDEQARGTGMALSQLLWWQHTQHRQEVGNHCQHSRAVWNPWVKHVHKSMNSRDNLYSRSFLSSLLDCQGKCIVRLGTNIPGLHIIKA